MKVLQLCTANQGGGAGIAAYRLHKGLVDLGVESSMLVNKSGQPDRLVHGPANNFDKVMARLLPLLDRTPGQLLRPRPDRVSSSWVPSRLWSRVNELEPNILNLHWVNDGFMRIETLRHFRQPIVWTFHDMWPLAGGEHYTGDNLRYQQGYGAANRSADEAGPDIHRWIWNRKKKAWSGMRNLVIASPSRWLADCARQSALFRDTRVEVLPNGVDHERFRPMAHDVVRSILGLPTDKKLILFGAVSATSDRRKGYHLLVETLHKLETWIDPGDYQLVVFGAVGGSGSFSMKTHYLGKLNDEISMALLYAAADVFLAPSLEDNLPNTVLESLSCGTPVVAFNIGGMPDMVRHQEDGYLAKGFDTGELAEGLRWVTEDHERWSRLSIAARDTVVDAFTLKHFAGRYLELYQQLLSTD